MAKRGKPTIPRGPLPSDEGRRFSNDPRSRHFRVGIEPVQWLAAPCAIQGDFTVSSALTSAMIAARHAVFAAFPLTGGRCSRSSPARPRSRRGAALQQRGRDPRLARTGKSVSASGARSGSAKEIVTACERPKGKAACGSAKRRVAADGGRKDERSASRRSYVWMSNHRRRRPPRE